MTNEDKELMHKLMSNMINEAKKYGDLIISDDKMIIKGNHPGSRGLIVMLKSLLTAHGIAYKNEDNYLEIDNNDFINCYVLEKLAE